MSRPGFFEGVGAALAASVTAAIGHGLLSVVTPGPVVMRTLVVVIGLGYIVYLLTRSPERVGRVTTIALWCVATTVPIALDAPLLWHVLVQASLVWSIRSLYHHSGVLAALADLALVAIGLLAALWAAHQSASMFLIVWCLFLVQALFGAIPSTVGRVTTRERRPSDPDGRFERAHRAADAALHKLSTTI